ncbi:MAG TPA: immune inhibitor A, partial [Saprospiraceae bacterium]|nr:immune inhibitor A [Saprospiraceae bacterium]
LNPKIKNGETLRYLLKINNGFYDFVDTISVQYFDANTNITIDQFNTNTLNDWTIPPGTWGNSKSIYYTPPASITDSPNGLYKNNADNIITLNKKIDLTKSFKAELSFYARWDLDQDFTVMQVAEEGTNQWVNMCGLYTQPGSNDQWLNEPLWDGSNLVWVKEKIDLNDFIGKKINIRFKLVSNAEFTADGFYFDDMLLETLDTFKVVSVKDIHFSTEMVIIPNPAQDKIRIQMNMESAEDLQYEIKNYLGTIVKPKSLFKLNESIDISDLNKGVYIITLSNQNIKGSRIFIK